MRFHAGFTWLCELYGASLTWRALRGDASDRCYAGAQSSPVSRHCSDSQPARCFCPLRKSLAGAAFCHPTVVCGQQISLRLKTSNYRFPQIVPSWHSGACCHPVPVEIRLFVSLYPTRIGITGFHPNRPETKRGAAVWPRPPDSTTVSWSSQLVRGRSPLASRHRGHCRSGSQPTDRGDSGSSRTVTSRRFHSPTACHRPAVARSERFH